MKSVVALKNRAVESASNTRDKYTSHSSGDLNMPDPFHSRKAKARRASPAPDELADVHIDWANLSQEDKETFFAWLDEFFARYLNIQQSLLTPPPPARSSFEHTHASPKRPPVPSSTSTPLPPPPHEPASPPPPSRFAAPPPPAAKKPPPPGAPRPPAPRPVSGAPPPAPLAPKPPAVNMSAKPGRPSLVPAEPDADSDGDEDDDWCVDCRDFSGPDEHAALFPRESVQSIAALAHDLVAPFQDEVDRARALFTWFHHNIEYDVHNFMAGTIQPSTPDSTLRTGRAVCEGYAGLFAALAKAAGVECQVVGGHGKGYGYAAPGDPHRLPRYAGNHAWNAVWLYGGWRLVEPTWGSGALHNGAYLKRFAPQHFCPGNREFGRKHFPDPRDPAKQFVAPHRTLTWEQYLLLPERAQVMGDLETLGYSEKLLRPRRRVLPAGGCASVVLKRGCVHLHESEVDAYVPIVVIEWSDAYGGPSVPTNHPQHLAALKLRDPLVGWTIDVNGLQRGQELKLAAVKQINGKDALGYTGSAFERARGRLGMSWGYLALWSVE
ncbi:hypothetical protein BKA62DRAFT_655141 [Auriculariales sp. MPI-PUGE-AT-0066]|nr:hypothetical protein BKA62DRAFT_655141 [Auriculariales sp. MPI-PUGE-AT-0066]